MRLPVLVLLAVGLSACEAEQPPPTPTATPSLCQSVEDVWRDRGLVQLTLTPPSPRAGEQAVIKASASLAPGHYVVQISDLEEIAVTVAQTDLRQGDTLAAGFTMPSFTRPCAAVSILANDGNRWVSPLFVPRP